MLLRIYDGQKYASFMEAVEQDDVHNLPVYGSFEYVSNNMTDLLRAACFKTVFTVPVVLVFDGKSFITVFHPTTVTPF